MPRLEFDHKRCGSAGKCLIACKYGVWEWFEIDGRRIPYPVNMNHCTTCKSCETICPQKAIKVYSQNSYQLNVHKQPSNQLPRLKKLRR